MNNQPLSSEESRYTAEADADIEVGVDLTESTSIIVWRNVDSDEDAWSPTPFQRADVRDATDALKKVSLWLATCYGT